MKNVDYKSLGFSEINPTRNYQKELDRKLKNLDGVPRLLLHSCCGPCSSYCLEYLSEYFEVTVFYYNPNIYPSEEYDERIEEQKKIIRHTDAKHPIHLIEGDYDTARYYAAVRGLEKEPEGGKRCVECFQLRLDEAAKLADEFGFDYFTTTLTISPHKDSHLLNAIGHRAAERYGARWLDTDFKKKNGYRRSVEITQELGIYRQDYCGCIFSKKEPEERMLQNRRSDEGNHGKNRTDCVTGESGEAFPVTEDS